MQTMKTYELYREDGKNFRRVKPRSDDMQSCKETQDTDSTVGVRSGDSEYRSATTVEHSRHDRSSLREVTS